MRVVRSGGFGVRWLGFDSVRCECDEESHDQGNDIVVVLGKGFIPGEYIKNK